MYEGAREEPWPLSVFGPYEDPEPILLDLGDGASVWIVRRIEPTPERYGSPFRLVAETHGYVIRYAVALDVDRWMVRRFAEDDNQRARRASVVGGAVIVLRPPTPAEILDWCWSPGAGSASAHVARMFRDAYRAHPGRFARLRPPALELPPRRR